MPKLLLERAQVGIGTLIVFIALVLVASIAAGVLIDTAGSLQTQSESTGQQSTDRVANSINVVGETGGVANITTEYDSSSGTVAQTESLVYELRLVVKRSPGAGEINLSEISIEYISENSVGTLVHVTEAANPTLDTSQEVDAINSGDEGEEGYYIEPIVAESGDSTVLTDDGDRYHIVIPIGIAYLENSIGQSVVGFDPDGRAAEDTLPGGEKTVNAPDPTTITYDDALGEPISGELGLDNTDLGLITAGETAQLTLTTAGGAQRTVGITAPKSLSTDEGTTVEL